MSRFSGRYPGGPGRGEGEGDESRRRPDTLPSAEEMEERRMAWARRSQWKRRRRRLLVGFVVAVLVAGGTGFWLGWQSHRTPEEIAREEEGRSGDGEGVDLSRERDIILEQLWLMEELERAPRR